MAKTKQKVKMPSGIRNKLMAAVSMLLVSTIMMVSTTYAWFTLSTAPEVKNISTTVAGNGSLEIALMPTSGLLGDIRSGNSATGSGGTVVVATANTTWGNLVSLDDASYGLSSVTLLPASLTPGSADDTTTLSTTSPLSTAVYGSDGRIGALEANTKLMYMTNSAFTDTTPNAGYGVRAIAETGSTAASFAPYGYVVDLAVRLNTENANGNAGKLLLQSAEKQRIYGDSTNADTNGGGSYMEFTAAENSNLPSDAMESLMNGIRVTFVQNYGNSGTGVTQKILGTAKLDTSANAIESADGGITKKARLYLYKTGTDGAEVKDTDAVLLDTLTKNAAAQISAVVWLDGTAVKNKDVAATAAQSLTGTLNLQFTTDVTLNPSANAALKGETQSSTQSTEQEVPVVQNETQSTTE